MSVSLLELEQIRATVKRMVSSEIGTATGRPTDTIDATPFIWRSTSEIPRREYLYGSHLVRGYLALDIAPGGVGKSSQIIVDALSMAAGRPLLGDSPSQKARVWLWNGEDPREEIERRIAAACAFYEITAADLEDRLFVDSGRDTEIVLATEERSGIKIATPVIEGLKRTIIKKEIDVLIVDPFVTSHSVSENDNTKIAAVAKLWARIADDCRCAIHVVHHVRKGDGKRELSADDARGAGALVNAARAVRVLNPMTPKEATASGLKKQNRFRYFKVSNGKSNLAIRSEHTNWRQIMSQPMNNGSGFTQPQDHVGVVAPWKWPSSEDLMTDVPNDALETIKSHLRTGLYREHEQAKDWAGTVVADVLHLDLTLKEDKARVKQMINEWVRIGELEIVSDRCPIKRQAKKFLRVKEKTPHH